jgi:flavin-dependent dehydrogenase
VSAVDALIVGAGPAGAASALALLQAGIDRVAIVKFRARHRFRFGESASPDLGGLLHRLGLSNRLEELGHQPCFGNLSLWGGTVPAVDDFLRRAVPPGWHLDRPAFDAWLLRTAVERGATLTETSGAVAAAPSGESGWCVRFDARGRATHITAAIVIVATGRAVPRRLRFAANLHRVDDLIALTVTSSGAHWHEFQGYSLVEAVELGWWYAVRQPTGGAIVTLMTDRDLARVHHLHERRHFVRVWAQSKMLKHFVPPPADGGDEIVILPAATQYLDRAAGPRWMAVGDALMALDPLSSAGISGALRDALDVAAALAGFTGRGGGADAEQVAAAYSSRASETLRRFFVERRATYARELRWPDSLFWRRRQSEPCVDVPSQTVLREYRHRV